MNNISVNTPLPRMRTIKQTAQETGLHEYYIRQLVKQNKITYVRVGTRGTLVNLDKFIEYLNAGDRGESHLTQCVNSKNSNKLEVASL